MTNQGNLLVGFGRLLTMRTDGSEAKLLGKSRSAYAERMSQVDANIIDWLGGNSGEILMVRDNVADAGKMNTRIVSEKSGLGVDRVNVTSLKSSSVEPPRSDQRNQTSGYMARAALPIF